MNGNNEIRYRITTLTDGLTDFVHKHKKSIVLFCLLLVVGLTIGVISATKPTDAQEAFAAHNASVYSFIENAGYLAYVFSSLFLIVAVLFVSAFVGRFSYSFIITGVVAVVFGYFQGGTVTYIIRIYGVIGVPFVIVYSVMTVLIDIVIFGFFALLSFYAYDARKYGCRQPFLKTLVNAAYCLVLVSIVFIPRCLLLIIMSFFL